jgi:adenylate cyclase
MHILLRGSLAQRLRIASGLVLFIFATTHLLNHALGLVGLEAMEAMQTWRQVVTRSIPGTVVLAAALLTHIVLGLVKLARRTTLRLRNWELVQIVLGLAIPFLLLPHIVNTRIAHVMFGVQDHYVYELANLWPASAVSQSILLAIVWLHGCIGLHYWLRLYEPYRAAQPALLILAIALPVAALAGFVVSGRDVAASLADARTLASVKETTHWPDASASDSLELYRWLARLGFAAVLALVALALAARQLALRTGPKSPITYTGGPTVQAPIGPTLLEISRRNRVPHASVCGGRARCSTCRVRVDEGAASLAPPMYPEAVTLGSISAPGNVRLACQLRPSGALTVTRLLRAANATPRSASLQETDSAGVEKAMAVMFLDLRDFTSMSQSRLPFDVVYILNEFFGATGAAITAHGGWIDKFLGDGLLALFGQHVGVEAGCRQALRAARAIDLALDAVNAKLGEEVGKPLRVGIGIHAGSMLLGRIGYGEAMALTVIGNAVNVASRLEGLTKQKGVQIIISADAARYAGFLEQLGPVEAVEVRGVSALMEVVAVTRGRDLPAAILDGAPAESTGTGARTRESAAAP